MNQVAEGVKAASVIMEFANEYGLNMPIAREVDGVINHGATPEGAYRGLAAEKPGHEVHGAVFLSVRVPPMGRANVLVWGKPAMTVSGDDSTCHPCTPLRSRSDVNHCRPRHRPTPSRSA